MAYIRSRRYLSFAIYLKAVVSFSLVVMIFVRDFSPPKHCTVRIHQAHPIQNTLVDSFIQCNPKSASTEEAGKGIGISGMNESSFPRTSNYPYRTGGQLSSDRFAGYVGGTRIVQ